MQDLEKFQLKIRRMVRIMEIEKKFLVSDSPDLSQAVKVFEIEQGYLCSEPTVRIRRKNDDYILTYKNRIAVDDEALNVSDEREMPLTKDSFFHLKQKCDGICIKKTRYCIPYQNYMIELDIFHDRYEGLILAEVEFDSVEESKLFEKPSWFLEDVSGKVDYTNSYLAQK